MAVCSFVVPYYTLPTWSYNYVVVQEIQSHPENRREVARIHLQPHHNAIAMPIYVQQLCTILRARYIVAHLVIY